MRCQVLLFAQLAEQIGHRELDLELADDATVGDALDALCREHAVIGALRDRIAVAVDEVYEAEATILTDGCTMALIPPVSGG
jgi:molybdopterin converting factor subunit 1